jgi:hypothetical protein
VTAALNNHRKLTQQELVNEARERFGDNPLNWAFQCPTCCDVATGQDFRDALTKNPRRKADGSFTTASDFLGRECIGRTLGALNTSIERWEGAGKRGCDWAAWGLFRGPWEVELSNGRTVYGFPLAEAGA